MSIPARCGTPAAYMRHYRRGESCEVCGNGRSTRRALAPCGTTSAYIRHQRHRETCEACGVVDIPRPRSLAPCGTSAARRRHWRHGEMCDVCDYPRSRRFACGTRGARSYHRRRDQTCELCEVYSTGPCGTPDRVRAHVLLREPLDDVCVRAWNANARPAR
ncbi:hypothetical protein FOE67_06350, partial [Streptomyces calidiresistens]|nr:hypothetical protein [Streptomyces calidiresistens]